MIYIPVCLLEPGMVLASDVPSSNPMLPLLVLGQTLTKESIKNVTARGIKGLYVGFGSSEDIQYEEIIPPEKKQVMLTNIKQEFDKIQKRNAEPNYRVISSMAEDIVQGILSNDRILCNVMDIRDYDNYTYSHSLSVGMMAVVIGKHYGLTALQLVDLATAGILHDIGKLDIPVAIVNKPAALTTEEFEVMKEHPMRAVKRMWRIAGCKDPVIHGVATHHEHLDGTGYPLGIRGTKIPLFGRILAIADVYDALSSNRSYRKAWTPTQVIDYITSRSDTQFDPELLTAFLHSVAAYPVGTLVKLSDDGIGIVIKNNPEFILRPKIRLLTPEYRRDVELDLSKEAFNITILDILSEPTEALHLI